MAYTLNELILRVSAKIDEILPGGDNIPDGALVEAPINYIEDELQKSADSILRQAPRVQIKQVIKKGLYHYPVGSVTPATPATNPSIRVIASSTAMAYVIPVPTDFLRFVDLELSTWAVPVSELIEQSDPKYRKQKTNPWTRGTELKPVAALVSFSDYLPGEINASFPNQGLAIECFSSKTAPTIDALHYVPKTAPIAIPDDLLDAMIWECAGRTLLIMNQAQRASIAFEQAKRYFTNKYGIIGE